MQTITIGKLAKQSGLGAGALRYYERLGLITPMQRTAAGYRIYHADAAQRLRFIRRVQALGFSLDQILELLLLSDNPNASAAEVKQLTREKIADIEARIRDLKRMKQELEALEERCHGQGSTADCPILVALNQGEH